MQLTKEETFARLEETKEYLMHVHKPTLLIFASGTKDPKVGGSGFENLVNANRNGILEAEIVGVVSNHEHGSVRARAVRLGIPFYWSPKGRTADDYRRFVDQTGAEWIALSGWLGRVKGHDPRTTFNIHPAIRLECFGGEGFHGRHVHEAMIASFRRGEVKYSGVTMHFATKKYDDPAAVFFQRLVPIEEHDDAETLGKKVNALETV